MCKDLEEGRVSVDTRGRKSIPGRGNSQCKGPEAGSEAQVCLVYLRNSMEASVSKAEVVWWDGEE